MGFTSFGMGIGFGANPSKLMQNSVLPQMMVYPGWESGVQYRSICLKTEAGSHVGIVTLTGWRLLAEGAGETEG